MNWINQSQGPGLFVVTWRKWATQRSTRTKTTPSSDIIDQDKLLVDDASLALELVYQPKCQYELGCDGSGALFCPQLYVVLFHRSSSFYQLLEMTLSDTVNGSVSKLVSKLVGLLSEWETNQKFSQR